MVSRSTTFFKLPRCIKAPVTACIVVYVPLEAWDVFSAEKSFYSFLKVTLENSWNFKLVSTKLLIILNVILRSRDKLDGKAMTLMDSCICSNKSLSSSCRTPPPPSLHHMMVYYIFTSLHCEHSLLAFKSLVHLIHQCHAAEVSERSSSMLKEQTMLHSPGLKHCHYGTL